MGPRMNNEVRATLVLMEATGILTYEFRPLEMVLLHVIFHSLLSLESARAITVTALYPHIFKV